MLDVRFLTLKSYAYAEERLAALAWIGAGVAFAADVPILAWFLVCKASVDTICALRLWAKLHKLEKAADDGR